MTGITQTIIDWSRNLIPDNITMEKVVRNEDIGRTAAPTGTRESFFVKYFSVSTPQIYVEPYMFQGTATFSSLTTTDKYFLWDASLQKVTFPNGDSDISIKPTKFKPVLANYTYNDLQSYSYTDTELSKMLPSAIEYLNNVFGFSYTYTGTGTSIATSASSGSDKELVSKALAIVVRKHYIGEQKKRGLGIRFRSAMMTIDTVQQLKEFNNVTARMEKDIYTFVENGKIGSTGAGQIIDIYEENIVED